MRTVRSCLGLLALTAVLCVTVSAQAKVRVVATLPSLASIAEAVGGEWVEVKSLAAATEDPHFVDARPNLLLSLNKANLLVLSGLELEDSWLKPLLVASRNPQVQVGGDGYVIAANFVTLLEAPAGRIDRTMGDLHPGGNPHFLNEPTRVAAVAEAVGRKLSQMDTEHAAAYAQNTAAFTTRLRTFAAAQSARFAALPEATRQVVTYHKSMAYLLGWLNLREAATLEPRPGVAPDPSHVAAVLSTMRSKKVGVIVQEEYYPSNNSRTLAQLAKGQLVVIHGSVRFNEHEDYVTYLNRITDDLFQALTHPAP